MSGSTDDPDYIARREADIARERQLADDCEQVALELIQLAGELHWYSHDPYEAAAGWIEKFASEARAAQPTPEPVRKRRPLPTRAVWDRDGWTCQVCGTHKNLTVDHIVPWSKGGSDDMDNLRTLCGSCNSRKGDRDA